MLFCCCSALSRREAWPVGEAGRRVKGGGGEERGDGSESGDRRAGGGSVRRGRGVEGEAKWRSWRGQLLEDVLQVCFKLYFQEMYFTYSICCVPDFIAYYCFIFIVTMFVLKQ